jgi:hypothetical protein
LCSRTTRPAAALMQGMAHGVLLYETDAGGIGLEPINAGPATLAGLLALVRSKADG